nr:transposase [Nitrosomonas sp. Nm58]
MVDLYPKATVIRAVLDNLNTHKMASLYEAFPAEQARELARKLEFHYTPKHGSWPNIAGIELAVLSNTCLSRRIPDKDRLRREVEANVQARNVKAMPVKWRFTTQDARRKLARLYPYVSA